MIEKRRFQAGEVILRENDLGETAYILTRGSVAVSKRVGDRDVRLAVLGPGETCGEMSLVDDKPRSATVTALEPTEVQEIDHDGFFEALQTDPDLAIELLRALFERLREADARLLRSQRAAQEEPETTPTAPPAVLLEGLTDEARAVLPREPFVIDKFPFRIGRQSHNPLVHNDLELSDSVPWQISRHHVALVVEGARVGIVDRGSHLGCAVDDRRLGGETGDPGPQFLRGSEGMLVLGNESSPFRFRMLVKAG